ncbi:heme peroxidase [Phaeosphaeria sp. MPI-PUGE-AT-0046c]|nr:heme peroxidase [Phaeosphaeria sp. MPI-PUGE-AT-0046c]
MMADAKAAWENHVDTRTGTTPPRPAEPSELAKLRASIGGKFTSFAALLGAASAPLPATGDGSKIVPEEDTSLYKKVEATLKDLSHLRIENFQTLAAAQKMKLTGEMTDDKTYFMEHLIQTAAKLPDGSGMREKITHTFLEQLWNDLEHPPQSYLGEKYQYRSADGSNNSLLHPQLGQAGTPYARTVKPAMMQTPARPDPGLVFDSIMTRKHAEKHPNRISSMLFYLASIIIHDCFRTSHQDVSVSMTSSYLDLSPLYGSNQAEQDLMRTKVDGKIKPDCFSEARLLFFPPGVGALLIMFNRFHNYVVENLALVNEKGRFNKPPTEAPKATGDEEKDKAAKAKWEASTAKYDNDLFQTGRLITCGLYVNIILIDYVRTILNLNRTDDNWQLNPRADMENVPIGVGNQVSAEFNLVYRWHSTVSDKDEKWTQEIWDGMFGAGRDPKTISKGEFLGKLNEVYKLTDPDPSKRKFANLKRNADGTLPDDGLVSILVDSIEDCANSFGPNRVPAVFRAIEVLGIEQARSWNLGSLNEFRKYFKLEPHNTFEDITSDTYVQEQLKHLYDHPDKVEIYPGIVVEDAKKPMAPGSGLCPGYTVSRAVLSDAVALVRGDRFYTKDYNPRTLTNWGYAVVDSDLDIDNGCVFYKLFLRAFPKHFKPNSVYAHYPLTVPEAMGEALRDLGKKKFYDFSVPEVEKEAHVVKEYALVKEMLHKPDIFQLACGSHLDSSSDSHSHTSLIASSLTSKKDWQSDIATYFAHTTSSLLAAKSHLIASLTQVDIIRSVGNLAPLHFAAESFLLPLKTSARPRGIFTEAEMHLLLASMAAHMPDPVAEVDVHIKAKKAMGVLSEIVEGNVDMLKGRGVLHSVTRAIWQGLGHDSGADGRGKEVLCAILAQTKDEDVGHLVRAAILPFAAQLVAGIGAQFARVIEFFLLGAGREDWAKVQDLAHDESEKARDEVMHYVLEAGRLTADSSITVTAAAPITLEAKAKTFDKGDRIVLDLYAPSRSSAFAEPNTINLKRDVASYVHLSHAPELARVALTTMVREVAKLKGVRAAPGPQGEIHKVWKKEPAGEGEWVYLTEMQDRYVGWATTMKVVWDQ